jgi:cellulose synthase/poly-beta-1,6-N-acetylglucosamine synthase-like glycosyltransferase
MQDAPCKVLISENSKPLYLFSVVVPTHGRVDLVKKLLLSLKKAALHSKVATETIIVDDSTQSERDKIEDLCKHYGAKYISGSHNVREKRNCGIKESRGEIVLFVDSDCEVVPNIFEEHIKIYNEPDTGGVLGVTEFTGKESFTWNIVRRTKFLDSFSFAKTLCNVLNSAPWGTCTNLSFRKQALENVGKFDTTFPFRLGGDDVELGIRMNNAGYKIKMNPDATVFHTRETWSNLLVVAKRVFRWGRMDYYIFYKKHKDKISLTSPKPIMIFLFLLFFGLIRAIMNNTVFDLSFPFIWLSLFLSLNALLKITFLKDPLKNTFFEIPAQFLHFLFDLGTVLESIKNRSLLVFFKEPMYGPGQVLFLWNEKVREVWCIVLSIFVTLLILIVI